MVHCLRQFHHGAISEILTHLHIAPLPVRTHHTYFSIPHWRIQGRIFQFDRRARVEQGSSEFSIC